jgi:ankyrin repeat protein
VPIIEFLLKDGDDAEHQRSGGWSALHWAASYHRFDAVSYLLKIGARPDLTDRHSLTPLHCACFEMSSVSDTDLAKATVELLVAHCPAMIHARGFVWAIAPSYSHHQWLWGSHYTPT